VTRALESAASTANCGATSTTFTPAAVICAGNTAQRNAYLERLLRKRSVPYSSELRNSHLQGMVAFLPAGDISHRDFVTHAWADNPTGAASHVHQINGLYCTATA
jgi:hypothetical protein